MSSSTERPAGSSVSADPSSWRTPPLSDPLQVGLRFLPHPFPAASSASFAVGLPSRGGDGGHCNPRTWPRTVLVQAYQHLWLVSVYGLYQHFTWVDLSRTAGPRPP